MVQASRSRCRWSTFWSPPSTSVHDRSIQWLQEKRREICYGRGKTVKTAAGLLLMFLISALSAAQAQAPHELAESSHASTQDSANELFVAVGKSVLIDIAK